jgi:hypothetical protein
MLTLSVPGWEANLYLAEEPHVADESQEMAEYFSACPRPAEIGRCRRRVEVWRPTRTRTPPGGWRWPAASGTS